ncbi:MAG TPA: NAD(P)/FAD-dependent oxidoreductase [Chloroflexota bacterium]|nr:NAD(P)/FAD-dependent oxidoreductase [Chloroflexota bacterium]
MTRETSRVVIVGGGMGGLYAARALARRPVRVTVIDRHNYHLFQPLLYQVATAALSPGEIAQPIRSVLRRYPNVEVLLGEVTAIDLPGRRVLLGDESVPYDYLILSPGSSHSYFGKDEWAPLAPGLKWVDDALEIRRRILLAYEQAEREKDPQMRRALLTFVVVGGGPTGVELAGAMAEIARQTLKHDFRTIDPAQSRIVLLEAGPRVLPTFPEELSASAVEQLQRLGVEVRTGAMVTAISPTEVRIGQDGEAIETRTALWAAGVQASSLLRTLSLPLDRNGRVTVEPDLTLPGHPEAYVIGDAALYTHQGGRPLPGVAQVAIQGGRLAAENIWRTIQGLPRRPFRYRNLGNMATIGRRAAVADLGWLRFSGFLAWVLWLVVHIFWLIGFDNRVLVFIRWAWSYFTYQRGARLITGPVEVPLLRPESE